jgi:Gpi18-like mannosyltransferase
MRLSLNDNRVWYAVLAFSVSLRLVVAPFTGHPYDLGIWMMSGRYVAAGTSPYVAHPHIGYPPLWALWCGVAYSISNYVSAGNQFLYISVIKIPIIASDFVLAIMILMVVSRSAALSNKDNARILVTSFLLNPYVLMVGVIWGMMDNLVAVLLIASIMLITSRPSLSGAAASLAVALKLYPILFLPLLLVFSARTRKLAQLAKWLLAFITTSFVAILLPFILFHWNIDDFIGVGVAQVARNFGAIAPLATLQYFENLGVTNIGPISLQSLTTSSWLVLLWIPALTASILFVIWKRPRSQSTSNMIRDCLLVYLTYLLTAPWVSEQLFELALILLLFIAAFVGLRRIIYVSYAVGSLIVLPFLTFHVPITSFVFPIYQIGSTPLALFGRILLPWLTLIFGCYLIAEITIIVKTSAYRQ